MKIKFYYNLGFICDVIVLKFLIHSCKLAASNLYLKHKWSKYSQFHIKELNNI